MLVTALEEDRRKLFQSGLPLRGEQKGRIEEKIETARAMLAMEMELKIISNITKLTESQLVELRDGFRLNEKVKTALIATCSVAFGRETARDHHAD